METSTSFAVRQLGKQLTGYFMPYWFSFQAPSHPAGDGVPRAAGTHLEWEEISLRSPMLPSAALLAEMAGA